MAIQQKYLILYSDMLSNVFEVENAYLASHYHEALKKISDTNFTKHYFSDVATIGCAIEQVNKKFGAKIFVCFRQLSALDDFHCINATIMLQLDLADYVIKSHLLSSLSMQYTFEPKLFASSVSAKAYTYAPVKLFCPHPPGAAPRSEENFV